MADRSGVRLAADVTMEGERESFSNRGAKRKILPENNVLTALFSLLILRARRKIRARQNRGGGRAQSRDCRKSHRIRRLKPLKNRLRRLRRPKNQPKLDESVQLD